MSVIGSNILAGASGQGGEYTIEESLRFNASQSSYLSWTPASAGNRKTWTWSGWVKRGQLSTAQELFSVYSDTSNLAYIGLESSDKIIFLDKVANVTYYKRLALVLRDPSAWFHLHFVYDTTNATAGNRYRFWINGIEQTALTNSADPPLNRDGYFNTAVVHNIARYPTGSDYFDGYMTEVNFIDGQALDASSFGEFDATTGVWKPKEYTGTYGTNGFYLPMKLDNTVEGFNTVTWAGNSSTQQISGVGFSPDLVWLKVRNDAQNHRLFDTVRGATKRLMSSSTAAEFTATTELTTFDTDGFTLGANTDVNGNGYNYVAWCWDAGNTTVSNTDGSITSSVRANPTYGFSVVNYVATGSNATVGHGLTSAPEFIIVKHRDQAGTGWIVYYGDNTDYLVLNSTGATIDSVGAWNDTSPTSTVFSVGANGGDTNNTLGGNTIAYCFHSVAGYSKIGSYTGTGAAGNVVTTGFKPAFVMIKCSNRADNWVIFDTTRGTVNGATKWLIADTSGAEIGPFVTPDVTDTGFILQNNSGATNNTGDTYIYMAFKDTREYAFWLDDSGNNNDWQPNGGITTLSTVTDTPTPYLGGGNYATWNRLSSGSAAQAVLTNANLNFGLTTSVGRDCWATITPQSGKWYWEVTAGSTSTSPTMSVAVSLQPGDSKRVRYNENGTVAQLGLSGTSGTGSFTSYTTGDVIGIAFDVDSKSVKFYKNNTLQTTVSWTDSDLLTPYLTGYNFASSANFGQRPFAYTPPTGFKALHTGNLPDSTIVDGSKHFDAVTWTSDGTDQFISTGFDPDFLWYKSRTQASDHYLIDVLRSGALNTNNTDAEGGGGGSSNLGTGGFTINAASSGNNIVGWNWKAGGTGVTNTDGSITSTVSANPTAGFSIVTYTGTRTSDAGETGTPTTIGHGLGVKPAMVITKARETTTSGNWNVWHVGYQPDQVYLNYQLFLNTPAGSNNAGWQRTDTGFSSTTFCPARYSYDDVSGIDYVAYCFAEVESYSKFGSYVGNGSSDGTFVYTGFRPAFVMVKRSSGVDNWAIFDTSRLGYNPDNNELLANTSGTEGTADFIDIVSNGFKNRNADTRCNASGSTYIYMAFAENPFKNSLAR